MFQIALRASVALALVQTWLGGAAFPGQVAKFDVGLSKIDFSEFLDPAMEVVGASVPWDLSSTRRGSV